MFLEEREFCIFHKVHLKTTFPFPCLPSSHTQVDETNSDVRQTSNENSSAMSGTQYMHSEENSTTKTIRSIKRTGRHTYAVQLSSKCFEFYSANLVSVFFVSCVFVRVNLSGVIFEVSIRRGCRLAGGRVDASSRRHSRSSPDFR